MVELDIDPTMMSSYVSEGKLGTMAMVQWVRMLGYQVLQSGIEPSLPPAATFVSISTLLGLDLEVKLMPSYLLFYSRC